MLSIDMGVPKQVSREVGNKSMGRKESKKETVKTNVADQLRIEGTVYWHSGEKAGRRRRDQQRKAKHKKAHGGQHYGIIR